MSQHRKKKDDSGGSGLVGALVVGAAAAISLGLGYLIGKEVEREEQQERDETALKQAMKDSSASSASTSSSSAAAAASDMKDTDEGVCKLCYDMLADTVLLPCRHQLTCSVCTNKLTSCPVCRADVKSHLQVFKS